MVKRMLIDASHAEETRVVVATGTRLDEFDFESAARKQLKGNIYLAKVTRVEPSLQAAFVDYGGNRHGFLPFSEIHPDYYQIPVSDREALQAAAQATIDAEADDDADGGDSEEAATPTDGGADDGEAAADAPDTPVEAAADADDGAENAPAGSDAAPESPETEPDLDAADDGADDEDGGGAADDAIDDDNGAADATADASRGGDVEELGGDEMDDIERRRLETSRALLSRRYRIQEVVRKRQIMLVQVVKEERGNKGAALTTYLSLAGRYIVLMPNAVRGGGISRKIVNSDDRRRLKRVMSDLEIPARMGIIVRTAGVTRSKAEIKRDFDYLLRQWETIREQTLQSTAPCLINEEANLIRRSIRDLYTRDVDEILVEGDEGYRTAKAFMRTLIPSHTAKVQPYRDRIPLFTRYQVESQLDSMYSPTVQLRSGGYLVINPTEALVSIDVNSGRSTRERNLEETALKTNQEAAEEIARQLRLRDLAGLIVIDFIDMDENRNQRSIERRLKEAMRNDRARIQIGRISPFGLLELSRQRLRPSLLEASMERCAACEGTGVVRSVESSAVHVLRAIEEEGLRERSAQIRVRVPTGVALYVLNQKRRALAEIETRYSFEVTFHQDESLVQPAYEIERLQARAEGDQDAPADVEVEADGAAEDDAEQERGEGTRKRRRRRRKSRGAEPEKAAAAEESESTEAESQDGADAEEGESEGAARTKRRRRGKRGGRRRTARTKEEATPAGEETTAAPSDDAVAAEEPTEDADATAAASEGAEDAAADQPAEVREIDIVPSAAVEETPAVAESGAGDPSDDPATTETDTSTPPPSSPAVALTGLSGIETQPVEAPAEEPATPRAAPGNGENPAADARGVDGEPADEPDADDEDTDDEERSATTEPLAVLPDDDDTEPPGAPRRRGWWQRLSSPR